MSFDRARRIADAVLLEGYVLYPYRASSTKNRWRFPFGVLAPRVWSEAGGCEPWWLEAQCLVAAEATPRLRGLVRFLRARRRTTTAAGAAPETWDEGEPCELELAADARDGFTVRVFELAGGREEESPRDGGGAVVRERGPVRGRISVRWEPLGDGPARWRVSVRVENETPWVERQARRDAILPSSCLATHLVLAVEGGAFLSLLDPPPGARAAAEACRSTCTHPVLVGADGRGDLVLAAPIILPDHPRIAPESPGDFFDATEIDELLALRTRMLTEDEKREARATDPRAAALLDRVDALGPGELEQLHGAFRDLAAAEMAPRPATGARTSLRPGDRVRLRPSARRTDAQDLLYAGHVATVRAVREDVDGGEWLAVTIDDDPAAELHDWYGRHHHYRPDEVEPVGEDAAP